MTYVTVATIAYERTSEQIFWRQHNDVRVAGKVGLVERENVRDAVPLHRGDKPSVMRVAA